MLEAIHGNPHAIASIMELVNEMYKYKNGDINLPLGSSLQQRLADKTLKLELTDAARELVIDKGFDPAFGARPLKRFIQRSVETLIARKLVQDEVPPRSTLRVGMENGAPVIREVLQGNV